VVARNWASDRVGSIHHDATARSKGFPAGLVTGDVTLALVQRALVSRWATDFLDRGWMVHTFVAPAYNGDELRVDLQPEAGLPCDADVVSFRLVRRDDGSALSVGRAGVYESGVAAVGPWWRPDHVPPSGGDGGDPLPHEPAGTRYENRTAHAEPGEFATSLDDNPWYTESSPWGEPVMPPVAPFNLAHRIRPTRGPEDVAAEMRSGMNSRWEAVHRGPLRYGRRYLRTAQMVEKATKGRYGYRTVEFALHDPEEGTPFEGRWRIAWVRFKRSASST
jgi:hypothetical protein